MDEDLQCTCPPGRALGADHRSSCPMWEFTNLDGTPRDAEAAQILVMRNPDTGRPVAVPEEIVEEAEREYRAYKAFRSGDSWHDIAVAEKYPDGPAAAAAVKRYLAEGRTIIADMRREEVLASEVDYLRYLRRALKDGIDVGKVPSIMAGLATHDRMMKALALDQPAPEDSMGQTVVVPTDEFLARLKIIDGELADEDEADAG